MVVDYVHHHAQAVLVQVLHQFAELDDARRAVGIGAVAAFQRIVMEGIVAPVEGVLVADGVDGRLLLGRSGRVGRQ